MKGFAYMFINTLQLGVQSSLLNLCGFQESLKTFRIFEAKSRYVIPVLYLQLLFSHSELKAA